ncbi:GGDEF domain-containing protein [Alginatibacterium sediminis]|uniref:diguanylate cyclase n=1 Tax=Alginatibacterium sediminis TaxID=2164068 RepID=A0A420EBQ4_9ALTE|nr:GGDEF domain-containing protein [Alginatibacterium sediminis]RKF18106.1 GGDEF domain-containing protein [Alginatibacterium sediminis]
MTDVVNVKKQLALVRQQLYVTANSSTNQFARSRMNKSSINQLLDRLSVYASGYDTELDVSIEHLRDQLDKDPDAKDWDISELNGRLKQHSSTAKRLFDEQQSLVKNSASLLKTINGLPPKLREKIKEFVEQDPTHLKPESAERLELLLNYYHQALLNRQIVGLPPKQHDTPAPMQPKESLLDKRLHKRICDDLQRLITELDFDEEIGERLASIRGDLLNGIEEKELPHLCLETIDLIIKGSQQERRASQEFLFSLSESLDTVHNGLNDGLSSGRRIDKQSRQTTGTLKSQLLDIGSELRSNNNLAQLKAAIGSKLQNMAEVFREKERLEQHTSQLLEDLSKSEQQIRLLREEADEYKKRLNSQKQKFFIDTLTQVYNRSALDERIALEYRRWKRYGYTLGIAIIDIDHFKNINDQFGHIAGDKALKVIARSLQNSMRDTDFLARYGGEEFVIIMPNISGDNLISPLDNMRNQVKSLPFRFKDEQVSISISIGATLFREQDQLNDAFERADQALYESKNNGRDRVNII